MFTGHDLLRAAGAIVSLLEAPEGADADTFAAELSTWLDATEDKLSAYWAVSRRLDAEADELRGLERRLQSRRRYLEANAERIKVMATELLAAREALGEEPKIKGQLYSAWLATTTSVDVSVEPERLDECYRRVEVSVDKARVKRDLELGVTIHGAQLVQKRGVRWR
jgi:hypothetical protein